MSRAGSTDEEDPEASDGDPGDAPAPHRTKRTRKGSHRPPKADGPVSAWDDGAAGEPVEEEEGESAPNGRGQKRETVFMRARDTWWFEPLVALMVIVVLLVALFAYTQNWPPVYVVESMSMQHGLDDQLGLINTGDLVLAQKIATSSIVPYVVGAQTGFTTYGEYGDVILYYPNDNTSGAPIIHRAILFLEYNPGSGTFSAPDLAGLSCGNGDSGFYTNTGSSSGCGYTDMHESLILHGIGWQSVDVDIPMDPSLLGAHSGFLTMGDNNFESTGTGVGQGIPDQLGGLSTLVEPAWIIGVARGMIPWFGAIKLALDGDDSEVPTQSWQYLGVTVLAIVLGGIALHLFLRREGIEDPRRKAEEEEEEEEPEDGPPPRRPGRRSHAAADADDEEEDEKPSRSHRKHGTTRSSDEAPASSSSHRRGRPPPSVGRSKAEAPDDDDDDDAD